MSEGMDWKDIVRQARRSPSIEVKSYNNSPVSVAAEADVVLSRGAYQVPAVVLVQCAAPQDLLLGTNLLGALGIQLESSVGTSGSGEALQSSSQLTEEATPIIVKLLKPAKIPAWHACAIHGRVSQRGVSEGLFVPRVLEGEKKYLESDHALVSVLRDQTVVLVTRNRGLHPISLPEGEVLGVLEPPTE